MHHLLPPELEITVALQEIRQSVSLQPLDGLLSVQTLQRKSHELLLSQKCMRVCVCVRVQQYSDAEAVVSQGFCRDPARVRHSSGPDLKQSGSDPAGQTVRGVVQQLEACRAPIIPHGHGKHLKHTHRNTDAEANTD